MAAWSAPKLSGRTTRYILVAAALIIVLNVLWYRNKFEDISRLKEYALQHTRPFTHPIEVIEPEKAEAEFHTNPYLPVGAEPETIKPVDSGEPFLEDLNESLPPSSSHTDDNHNGEIDPDFITADPDAARYGWDGAESSEPSPTTTHAPAFHSETPSELLWDKHSSYLPSGPLHTSAPVAHDATQPHSSVGGSHNNQKPLGCRSIAGIEDIVYIIKTGATEAKEKLPVHFNTTLACFPNSIIFSDFAETMEGHEIHDALSNVTEEVRMGEQAFDLWRRLHEHGRAVLRPEELSDHNKVDDPNSGGGQPDNSGWVLDKFKNLPMIRKTLAEFPDKKWYMFTDADTYISYSNLIRWTQMMDHTTPLYMGSPAVIGDQVFGHGGSGYVLSHASMVKADALYRDNQEEWDQFAAGHWAGDCVLATALDKSLKIELTWAFPLIQGGDPAWQNFGEYGYDKQIWCYPTISYHHIVPATVKSLWEHEQSWTNDPLTKNEPIRHKNVFKGWAQPQMMTERPDWDNGASDEVTDGHFRAGTPDLAACRAHCEKNSSCYQWSFGNETCATFSEHPRLGFKKKPGFTAGWITNRVGEFSKELDMKCSHEGDWILPGRRRRGV